MHMCIKRRHPRSATIPTGPVNGHYSVRRSDRARRSRLTISDQGEVIVVLPRRAPAADADRLVARHAGWIERHVGRLREERARLEGRPPLGAGRVLEVDGMALRVWVDETASPRPDAGTGRTARPDGSSSEPGTDGRDAAAVLEAWLRARARGERSPSAWQHTRPRSASSLAASASATSRADGHRPHAAAPSPSAGGSSWRRRTCSMRSSSTSSPTCASGATPRLLGARHATRAVYSRGEALAAGPRPRGARRPRLTGISSGPGWRKPRVRCRTSGHRSRHVSRPAGGASSSGSPRRPTRAPRAGARGA